MLAMGDALAMVLLQSRGFRREDFAQLHPAGTLGRDLLLPVEEIMRPRKSIPICTEKSLVTQALSSITAKRCGAAIVVNSRGSWSGSTPMGILSGASKRPSDWKTHTPIGHDQTSDYNPLWLSCRQGTAHL